MIIDYTWYMVALCMLAGAVYAAVLYFIPRKAKLPLRWLLAALRFAAVSAICFLLLAPMTRRNVHERQKPHVVLAVDRSLSVALSADSAFVPELKADGLRVTTMAFGNAAATDIGAVLDSCMGSDADAIVLATDGIYNRGSNPATVAERLAVPVYTIVLGDTTPRRDATLADLRTNRVAMLGGNIPVEITVGATLLGGHSAQLTIADGRGRTLFSQRVAYDGDDYSAAVTASLPATEPGLQRFVMRLSVAEGEVNTENNVAVFFVDVIDTRRRVAIVADAPHPDLAALRRAIESNPNYEAEVIVLGNAGTPKLADYSLAILHNLPSKTHTSVDFAKDLPQIYVIGLQTDLPRLNALHAGLEITAKAQRTNEVTAVFRPEFTLFSIAADDAADIEQLPPLAAPFGESRLSEDMQTLFGARLGSIDTRQPMIAATAQGGSRRAFVWGEGLWRWRLADYAASGSHDRFDRLVQQLVGFAAMHDDRARLRVEAERTYPAGEPVTLRAQLYNEAYQLTNTPEVALSVSGEGEGPQKFAFHRDGDGYSLTLPDIGAGIYRYHASTVDGLTAEGTFAVEAIGLEQRRLVADHTLLRTVSASTGGEMYFPAQMDELRARLAELKPTIYTHTRYADFMGLPLVLALIVLLLAAEWIIRKYGGEI